MTKDLTVVGDVWDPTRHQREVPGKPWRPLPLDVSEITPEWLTAALSVRAPGLKVLSREITGERHGFTSLIFVRLELNEAGRRAGVPERIVLKGGFRSFARHFAHSYAMEAYAYRDVWPNLTINMPKVYFVDLELARDQTVIIMEDLNARGVTFGHGLRPQSYEMVQRRLSALAELHAATWESPEFEPGGKFYGILPNAPRMLRMHMNESGFIRLEGDGKGRGSEAKQTPPFFSPEGWETLWDERRSQNAAASHAFRDREWNRRALMYSERLSERLPNCVLHGDTHLGNHYEEPDGTPGFLDSQVRRDPPYFDVSYTITCGLDPYHRRRWERSLVGHYVAEMGRRGVTLDIDETMRQYALSLHTGFIVFIINDTVFQTPAFNTAHVWRFCQAMMDNNTKELFDAAFAAEGDRDAPARSASALVTS
jgi:hypothetical protein